MPVTPTWSPGTSSRPPTGAGTGTRPAGAPATAAAQGRPSAGARWERASSGGRRSFTTSPGEDDHVVQVAPACPVEGTPAGDQPELGTGRRGVDVGGREVGLRPAEDPGDGEPVRAAVGPLDQHVRAGVQAGEPGEHRGRPRPVDVPGDDRGAGLPGDRTAGVLAGDRGIGRWHECAGRSSPAPVSDASTPAEGTTRRTGAAGSPAAGARTAGPVPEPVVAAARVAGAATAAATASEVTASRTHLRRPPAASAARSAPAKGRTAAGWPRDGPVPASTPPVGTTAGPAASTTGRTVRPPCGSSRTRSVTTDPAASDRGT